MLDHLHLDHVLFLDIETAPLVYRFDELNPRGQDLWSKKTRWQQERQERSADELYEMAGIHAEFAKVVCVSVGYFAPDEAGRSLRIKSFAGTDEGVILRSLAQLLSASFKEDEHLLCAHNGKEFDFPFLARRYIVNGLPLPYMLDIAGKKPWEVKHLDTMNLWKFGDYKHYTSIDLLAYILDIPTPKDDITGADVARVYHEEGDIDRIATYCEKDVVTLARVLLRFKGEEALADDRVVFVGRDA